MAEGGGAGAGRLSGGVDGGGVHMTGSGTDTQGVRGLLRHSPSGGDVEGSGGDSKLPLHCLHQLPWHTTWFTGGLQHSYRFPQGQNDSEVNVHEGGGTVHDIYGPAQGV